MEVGVTERETVYNTELLDREIPTIVFERKETKNMTEGTTLLISVSDKTSAKALRTFEKIKKGLE